MKRYLIILFLFNHVFICGLSVISVRAEDLKSLLGKISIRMNSYPENNNWEYTLVTKSIETDNQWRPKKTTITKANIKVIDNLVNGELLEAVEIEDGKSKDISTKVADQFKEQIESANKEVTEKKNQKVKENEYDIFFPFNESKLAKYKFKRLNDDFFNERPVYIIEAIAKEKDDKLFEGKYYIDKKTCDILKAQIAPSKNPKFVKDMLMDIDFVVLPEGNFIRIKSKTQVNGGFLFKRTRMIFEEDYLNVKVLD